MVFLRIKTGTKKGWLHFIFSLPFERCWDEDRVLKAERKSWPEFPFPLNQ